MLRIRTSLILDHKLFAYVVILFIFTSCKNSNCIGVYYENGKFSERTVILNPDSTFFEWTSGHSMLNYSKGSWKMDGRNLIFKCEPPQRINELPIYKSRSNQDSLGFIINRGFDLDTLKFNLFYQGKKVCFNKRYNIITDDYLILKSSSDSFEINISYYNRFTIFPPIFRYFYFEDKLTEYHYYRNGIVLHKGQYIAKLKKSVSVKF